MLVYVTQDSEGEVVGVTSDMFNVQTGKAKGLHTNTFILNGMNKVGLYDRPWVVYFKDADAEQPQVWPVTEGFPNPSMEIHHEGIEVVVYAEGAGEAAAKACRQQGFDSWDVAVSDWEAMQS